MKYTITCYETNEGELGIDYCTNLEREGYSQAVEKIIDHKEAIRISRLPCNERDRIVAEVLGILDNTGMS